jgi:hypothetical protein
MNLLKARIFHYMTIMAFNLTCKAAVVWVKVNCTNFSSKLNCRPLDLGRLRVRVARTHEPFTKSVGRGRSKFGLHFANTKGQQQPFAKLRVSDGRYLNWTTIASFSVFISSRISYKYTVHVRTGLVLSTCHSLNFRHVLRVYQYGVRSSHSDRRARVDLNNFLPCISCLVERLHFRYRPIYTSPNWKAV